MNKNSFHRGRHDVASTAGSRSRKTRRAREMAGTRTAVRNGGPGGAVSAEAERLLAALGESHAEALADSSDPSAVLVRKSRKGVSVGAGRFSTAAAESLVQHDLAHWSRGPGPALLRITKAGEAHRRRREAGVLCHRIPCAGRVRRSVTSKISPAVRCGRGP